MTDQKQPKNVEYFNYFGSMINYATYIGRIKFRIARIKASFVIKTTVLTSKLDLNLRGKLEKCSI